MADAKFTRYSDLGGGSVVIPDDNATALDISSTDAKDYVQISTDNGSEKLTLSAGSHGVQILDAGAVQCTRSGGWALLTATPSATVPNFNPVAGDPDTGVGSNAADELSLIAGGVEAIRCVEDTTAQALFADGTTSLPGISFIDDPDTGIIRVESGGTGFVQNGSTKMQLGAGGDLMIASGGGGAQARLHVVGATAGMIVRAAVDHSDSYMLELRSSGNTEQITFKETGEIEIYNGTAPASSVTNGVQLYAEDVSTSSELKVRDEAGNVTTLSPHNFSVAERSDPMAWAYYSKNAFVGKEINVDMMAVIKAVEQLSGQSFIHERELDPSECRDWETEEQARVAKSQAAIEAYNALSDDEKTHAKVPQLYVAQPKPDWMS